VRLRASELLSAARGGIDSVANDEWRLPRTDRATLGEAGPTFEAVARRLLGTAFEPRNMPSTADIAAIEAAATRLEDAAPGIEHAAEGRTLDLPTARTQLERARAAFASVEGIAGDYTATGDAVPAWQEGVRAAHDALTAASGGVDDAVGRTMRANLDVLTAELDRAAERGHAIPEDLEPERARLGIAKVDMALLEEYLDALDDVGTPVVETI
jgi:hypothetical protein